MSTEPTAQRPPLLGFAEVPPPAARTPVRDGGRFAEQLDSAARLSETRRADESGDPVPTTEENAPADSQEIEQAEAPGAEATEDSVAEADSTAEENPEAEDQAEGLDTEEPPETNEILAAAALDQAIELPDTIDPATDVAPTTESVEPEAEPQPGVVSALPSGSEAEPDGSAQPLPQPVVETAEAETLTQPQAVDDQPAAVDLATTDEVLATTTAATTQAVSEADGEPAPAVEAPAAPSGELSAGPEGVEPVQENLNRQEQNAEQQAGDENRPSPTERILEADAEEVPRETTAAAVTRASTEIESASAPTDSAAASQPAADISGAAAVDRAEAPRPIDQAPSEAPRVDRPPTVDSNRFLSRVARAIDLANERGGPIQLRLSPPELGSLQVRIQLREGVLTASLEAETPAARQTLLDNLPALRDRLEQQQIRIDKFDVDVRDDSGQRGGDYQPRGDDGGRSERDANPRQPTTSRPLAPSAEAVPDATDPGSATARTIHFGDDTINLVA